MPNYYHFEILEDKHYQQVIIFLDLVQQYQGNNNQEFKELNRKYFLHQELMLPNQDCII